MEKVGAMLYISSHLTFLMLAIVPPISLGAVGTCTVFSHVCMRSPLSYPGLLWSVLEEAIE